MISRKIIFRIGIIVLLLSFTTIHSLWAQSSKAQLTDLVAQLQITPDVIALREKIIKLVLAMPSKPEAPDGLDEALGKVKYILKNGHSIEDFGKAADAYKEASLLAPWMADIYFNLGLMQEKAGLSQEALVSYTLYLQAKPNAKDRKNVREKIGAMEYATGFTFKELESPPPGVEGMVLIPAGDFLMGTFDLMVNESPQHKVYVDAFYMDKYLVTFDQYDKFCAATGASRPSDQGWGRGTRPVINVSWDDANAYCKWVGKRLPTEAEYEKAARGGTTTPPFGGDGVAIARGDTAAVGEMYDYGWYKENSEGMTHPVGEKKPNPYGLYDVLGNVYEWCSDWYADNYSPESSDKNPQGPDSGKFHSVRGGCSWWDAGFAMRSAGRNRGPDPSGWGTGFRCVKDAK